VSLIVDDTLEKILKLVGYEALDCVPLKAKEMDAPDYNNVCFIVRPDIDTVQMAISHADDWK